MISERLLAQLEDPRPSTRVPVLTIEIELRLELRCTGDRTPGGWGCLVPSSLKDGTNSVRVVVDEAGAVVATHDYDAFGNVLAESTPVGGGGQPWPFEHRAFGELYDRDLGMVFLRARWMDPSDGRFVSRDPFGGWASVPSSLHRYTYVEGDPLNAMDPSGQFSLIEGLFVLAIISIASVVVINQFFGGPIGELMDARDSARTVREHMLDRYGAPGAIPPNVGCELNGPIVDPADTECAGSYTAMIELFATRFEGAEGEAWERMANLAVDIHSANRGPNGNVMISTMPGGAAIRWDPFFHAGLFAALSLRAKGDGLDPAAPLLSATFFEGGQYLRGRPSGFEQADLAGNRAGACIADQVAADPSSAREVVRTCFDAFLPIAEFERSGSSPSDPIGGG